MGKEITLDMLMQGKSVSEPQRTELISAETVSTEVENLTEEQLARVEEIKNSIDLMDSQTAIQYGVGAQRSISGFSDTILNQVRNKDSGHVGELMSDMLIKVKEVGVDQMGGSLIDKLPILGSASRAVKKFIQKYEKLEVQIDKIEH